MGLTQEIHVPVLLNEVLSFVPASSTANLNIWDATLGAAGHSEALLKQFSSARLLGSDADQRMLEKAGARLQQAGLLPTRQVETRQGFFSDLAQVFVSEQRTFDFILLDLGISSYHLDEFNMGLSYRTDQVLDMRLNANQGETAASWLKKASEIEISRVLFEFGEERKARKIARLICEKRRNADPLTTTHIKEICLQAYKKEMAKQHHTGRHPYVKTLQALRIFTNRELDHLKSALETMPSLLKKNGRLAIISFHSLEDRMVKHAYKKLAFIEDHSPMAKSNFKPGNFKILTGKPVVPSTSEVEANGRSRSAKMRVIERVVEE